MEQQLKILIIAYYFYPDNSMGAVRPTKLFKYFSRRHQVDVLTLKHDKIAYDVQYANHILEIPYKPPALSKLIDILRTTSVYGVFRKSAKRNHNRAMNEGKTGFVPEIYDANRHKTILERLSVGLLYFQKNILEDMTYWLCGRKYICQKIDLMKKYDVVLSTFAPMSCHLIAKQIKKLNNRIIWIADFRDPVIHEYDPNYIARLYKRLMRSIEINADCVTAAAEAYLEELELRKETKKAVITNGFDADDYDSKSVYGNDKIRMVYTGQIYPDKQDFSALFSVIKSLLDSNVVEKNRIEICVAGPSGVQIRNMASRFGCEALIRDYGEINREQAISLQKSASFLLLATWNTEKEKGVVHGKFYEYLACKKPILCFVTGACQNSLMKQWIEVYRLGFCYEAICHETDYNLLIDYIEKAYRQFVSTGKIGYNPDDSFVQSYSYEKKAAQFIRLINEMQSKW